MTFLELTEFVIMLTGIITLVYLITKDRYNKK